MTNQALQTRRLLIGQLLVLAGTFKFVFPGNCEDGKPVCVMTIIKLIINR